MTVLKRTLLASLALATSAWAAQAQEATIKIGLVKSISSVANLWAMRAGLLPRSRHQAGAGGSRHLGERAGPPGSRPTAGYRRRHLRRLLQRDREEPSDHHGDGPCHQPARPQPDAAARSQGQDHAAQPAQGQGHREQRHGFGLDLRGRQDAGDRRDHDRRYRREGVSVPANGDRIHQQGDRCRDRHSTVHRAVHRQGLWRDRSRVPTTS